MTIKLEITKEQWSTLKRLSTSSGLAPEQIIGWALDQLEDETVDWRSALVSLAGIWKDRDDLPDFEEIRRSMDRDLWLK